MPAKPKDSSNSLIAQFRPFFDRIISGEETVVFPCSPVESSRKIGQAGMALRCASKAYADTSDPEMKPLFSLCGNLKFAKLPEGFSITRKKKAEVVRSVDGISFAIKNLDGSTGPSTPLRLNPESIGGKIQKHEKSVVANFRTIMRTGLSMLNRVNAAKQVIDMLEDPGVAPDFKDKLRELSDDCFAVFEEVVEMDIDACEGGNKERLQMEGAKLQAIKWLSEKRGENKSELWPPDTKSAAWVKRMERARRAAQCSEKTPGRIFENPAVLICFYDDDLNAGRTKLHSWQIEELARFARPLGVGEIHRQAVAAANGSGKSKNLGAPCAVWGSMENTSGVTVLTTASGKQLDKQSAKYIKAIARQVNSYHGGQLWAIQYRSLKFEPLDSDVEMFATDEPGQAEGWHPKVDGGYFAILVDEAKTVSEEIFSALQRCNGCVRRLDYSSPGQPAGHFYKKCTDPDGVLDDGTVVKAWMFRRVTAFDCPHITKAEINEVIKTYGENSPLTRSIIYAEFTSLDGNLVLTLDKINRCLRHAKEGLIEWRKEENNRAGLDLALSAGGDESVISVWNGNKQIAQHPFREEDLEPEVDKIIGFFTQYGLRQELIVADAGGLGKPIISRLKARGFSVVSYYAQSPPKTTAGKNFASRGTEAWHHFARLVEESEVILLEDPKLIDQLANRYYRATGQGKVVLESKREAKAAGHPSPDRADAAVLANVSWGPEPEKQPEKAPGRSIEEIMREMADDEFRPEDNRIKGSFPSVLETAI